MEWAGLCMAGGKRCFTICPEGSEFRFTKHFFEIENGYRTEIEGKAPRESAVWRPWGLFCACTRDRSCVLGGRERGQGGERVFFGRSVIIGFGKAQ